MTLTFPNSPALNDTYIYKDKTYKYDGKKWVSGFTNNNSISTEYIDYNNLTPTPAIDLDLRKYNFFELNLGTSPNLFSYPEDFTKSPPWIVTGLNGTMAGGQTELTPDYTQTADKITENSTASVTRIMSVNADFVKGTTYTVSMYVKRASGTRNFAIVLPLTSFGAFIGAGYDLGTGTINYMPPSVANASAKITNEGNGWYRCSITATATISSSNTIQFRMISGTDVYGTYTGNGTSALFWWAAKLEVGNLTSYIPPEITNKLKYSEQFSNSVWQKNNSTITPNQISAPDGTLTADLLLETATNGEHNITYVVSPNLDLTNRNYTYSIYVKKYNRSRLLIKMVNNANTSYVAGTINLDTVTATLATSVGSGVAVSCSITPDIDGWYRISLTGKTGVNEIQSMQLLVLDDTGTTPYTGDITKGVYVWGAQLQKDTLTSYQKTEALAYYNVNLIDVTENDMFLLKIKNQIKPDFNLELTAAGTGMTYTNNAVSYTTISNGSSFGSYLGIFVSPDGRKIFSSTSAYAGFSNYYYHYIHQNNISTPWDISSTRIITNNTLDIYGGITTDSTSITGIYISNDGTNLYISKMNTVNNIYHYVLPIPWNIVGAILLATYSITQASNVLHGITFKPDGTSMYILGGTTDAIFEYTLSTPWRIDTATYTAGNTFSVSTITTEPYSLQFSPDGTKLFFMSTTNSRLYQLDLTTAWKINTAVNNNKYTSTSAVTNTAGFSISPDGLSMIALRNIFVASFSTIYQYSSNYLGSLDYTITWPTNIKWDGGSPPSITKSNQNTLIEFYKYDGVWNAKLLANDI